MAELYTKLHAPKDMTDLWGRIGISIKNVSISAFIDNPEEVLIQAIKKGNVSLDGDSYVIIEDAVDDAYFDMTPTKIQLKD